MVAGREVGKHFRSRARLWVDQLQFIGAFEYQWRSGLWTDADPIDRSRQLLRAVGLHRKIKATLSQRIDQRRVDLQQGFASG